VEASVKMAEDRHRSRVIVTSVRADLTSGPLVRFVVNGDGTATGRMVPMGVQFMEVRSQRTAGTPDDDFENKFVWLRDPVSCS
jgi:hypothetical protein